jgi:UDP-N-acetylglucosamine 4,6-dehydratase/5-epimerase
MKMFSEKTLLISGGTGTFGNAVLHRFLKTDIKEIRIFSRDEKKQDEMRNALKSPKVKFYIGDVRDIDSILLALQNVDLVFHAAALKQVPSCEFFPIEALRTNALGTENVMNAALACKVSNMVVLSTDKAVYPINAMGISKAFMEKVMIAKARTYGSASTIFCGTRYGNVMGSRGSVIPLFIHQILSDMPITVTDLHMTRFMMSIDDALDLVVYALQNGHPGDILVQKAPAATLGTLVNALKKLFNKKNKVNLIGTRHGEKLHETLLTREEMAKADDLGRYFRIPADIRDLNYARFFTEGQAEVSSQADYTSQNAHQLDEDALVELLSKLDFVKDALETGKINL